MAEGRWKARRGAPTKQFTSTAPDLYSEAGGRSFTYCPSSQVEAAAGVSKKNVCPLKELVFNGY